MEGWDGISTRQGGLKLNPGVENSHVIRPLELDLSPGGGGGYCYIFLYGDVPLNRVSFSGFRLRDRVSFL